ncbi:type IV pili fiber building block protein [Candidatus Francisella endociliophora]|uniref:Type IV pili fiber building block protein n=1 Tax=Candidatus Francisella endociliophora TaxID=653937 RepID=A0A097EP06_9GAMM|nr:prepilin-type N-terminal cleavage/methylation domain-containing protein [Francisella sp. FSC1006]AIT09295.1 type IV pili fiber building block protein [Francisella sp. FSC1006]
MKKQMQKGFSLVELMVVIAIIAILAAVAIPMYSNYTTRAKLGSELAKLGGVKMEVAEQISNSNTSVGSTPSGITAPSSIPSGASVDADGTIKLPVDSVVGSDADIIMSPSVVSGAITWTCDVSGSSVSSSVKPSNCTG